MAQKRFLFSKSNQVFESWKEKKTLWTGPFWSHPYVICNNQRRTAKCVANTPKQRLSLAVSTNWSSFWVLVDGMFFLLDLLRTVLDCHCNIIWFHCCVCGTVNNNYTSGPKACTVCKSINLSTSKPHSLTANGSVDVQAFETQVQIHGFRLPGLAHHSDLTSPSPLKNRQVAGKTLGGTPRSAQPWSQADGFGI